MISLFLSTDGHLHWNWVTPWGHSQINGHDIEAPGEP